MRLRLIPALFLILAAGLAQADGSPPPSQPSMPSGGGAQELQGQMPTPRQQAEQLYADAWNDIGKAKDDLANGKDKNAQKKFQRALDRLTRATELDSTYYEAWNMVGYSSRKLKQYDASLAAYDRCLRIKPDYALAREYMGEAFFELGRMDDARAQLQWLDKMNAKELADQLRNRIATVRSDSTHADSTAATKSSSGW
jgi:tetratricopeptide (TPR) repeat protein